MKSKDRVWRHGELRFHIPHAKGFQIDGLAMLLDQNDSARQSAASNLIVEELSNKLELFWDWRRRIRRTSRPAPVRGLHQEDGQERDVPADRGCFCIRSATDGRHP